MATQRPHERPHDGHTKKKAWQPPRGIWYEHRPACTENPFWLFWRESGVKKWSKHPDEKTRETVAKAMAKRRSKLGTLAPIAVDEDKWRRWLEFEKIVGEGIDPLVVAVEWKAMRQGRASSTVGLWVKEAVEKYKLVRDGEKSWSKDAKRHAEKHLERFVDAFAQKRLNEVEPEPLRSWLFGLTTKDGEPMHALTIKDHRKNVCAFFEWAKREGLVANNPCDAVSAPRVEEEDVFVAPIREVFDFFKVNRDAKCIGRVALEAFGGVRYSTAAKIQKDGLNFERRGIRMGGKIHKATKTRYRQGQPDNLWAWLEHAPESCWTDMTALQYREAKRNAAIRSGLRPASPDTPEAAKKIDDIKNVWRHSFASYHLARFKDTPRTQYLMQHTDADTTEIYEGVADEIDAALYFAITPETVLLSWEEFVAKFTPSSEVSAA